MINIKYIVMDFDGVLTNNKVIVSENGLESVICDRSDGMAIKALTRLDFDVFILSSEKNDVIKKRSKKLKIKAYTNVPHKEKKLISLSNRKLINLNKSIYIGNDINDLNAMKICKYSACPKDSNSLVKKYSDFVINIKGGDGVIRELVEKIFKINIYKTLYN